MNNKRRAWVWGLTIFMMFAILPGILTVYFSRIDNSSSSGLYTEPENLTKALKSASLDCFSYWGISAVVIILAIVIALQGYSYLFSRRKVDMYHSVPVSMRSRFLSIYLNGIIMFTGSLLAAFVVCMVMILFRGIFDGELLAKLLMSLINMLFLFLGAYNLTVFAVMMTGNLLMATVLSFALIFYTDIWLHILNTYRSNFYSTLLTMYDGDYKGFSIYDLYSSASREICGYYTDSATSFTALVFSLLKMLAWIIIPIFIAYRSYKRRPAEAAGNSMAFYSSRLLVKLLIAVPAGLTLGNWMYETSGLNIPLMIVALVLGTIISAFLTEIAFNLEFKAAIKHWGIIIVALMFVLGIFAVFSLDLLKYDEYIPDKNDLESYAILNGYEAYVSDAIDFTADPEDYDSGYINPYEFAKNNMYLYDYDAIYELAKKSQTLTDEQKDESVRIDVYYRLKSGITRSRSIWVLLSDESNDDYLNRIIGPSYYKQGIWQAVNIDAPTDRINNVTYSNTFSLTTIDVDDVDEVVSLWRSDMSHYDYDRVRYDYEIGYINVNFDNYTSWCLPVYSCFDSLISFLKGKEYFIENELPAYEIESISITDSSDETGNTRLEYTDSETIERIMDASHVMPFHTGWLPPEVFDYRFSVEIRVKPEYISRYGTYEINSFTLLREKVFELKEAELLP